MFRIFKTRSPMSMGAWCLGASRSRRRRGRRRPARRRGSAQALTAATALLGTYLALLHRRAAGAHRGARLARQPPPAPADLHLHRERERGRRDAARAHGASAPPPTTRPAAGWRRSRRSRWAPSSRSRRPMSAARDRRPRARARPPRAAAARRPGVDRGRPGAPLLGGRRPRRRSPAERRCSCSRRSPTGSAGWRPAAPRRSTTRPSRPWRGSADRDHVEADVGQERRDLVLAERQQTRALDEDARSRRGAGRRRRRRPPRAWTGSRSAAWPGSRSARGRAAAWSRSPAW